MTSNSAFIVTDEQQQVRAAVRRLLEKYGDSARVRRLMADELVDHEAWSGMSDMGLPGLLIPSEYGGSAATFTEVGIVMEELGRALVCTPYLSSAVMATTSLIAGADEAQLQKYLPPMASGEMQATLAHLPMDGRVGGSPGVSATPTRRGWALSGASGFVLDAMSAELLIVAATVGDYVQLFVVSGEQRGISRDRVEVLDQTRPMAHVAFRDVRVSEEARLSGESSDGALARATDAGLVAIASDLIGGARFVHGEASDYARKRMQFGRPIGSFQAIKHLLVDLLVELESAVSVVMYAQEVMSGRDDEELGIAVPMAKALASEVAEHVAGGAMQVYGGIGFTWDHDLHLYLKRSKSSKLLLGSPHDHRTLLANRLQL